MTQVLGKFKRRVKMNEMVNFLKTGVYVNLAKEFSKEYNLKIVDFKEEDFEFYERIMKKELNSAKLSLQEIEQILEVESEKIKKFINLNITYFDKDTEQECSVGEEVEEDTNSISLGYSYEFIFSFAIRYHIMKNNPLYFEEYSKKMRMPYAKKYTKQVKKLYEEIEK
jgi:regulator of sigma D